MLITFEVVAPFTAAEIAVGKAGSKAFSISPYLSGAVVHILVIADGRREDKIVVASAGVPVAEQKFPIVFRWAGGKHDAV